MTARQHSLTLVFLALFAAGLYGNTLFNGFVFDDHDQIEDNTWIRDFHSIGTLFTHDVWAFAGKPSNYYRPLMSVTYLVGIALFGPSPLGFHVLNVLIHVGVTLLVFLLLRRLLPNDPGWAALVGAVLFAAHPVHVEAVAWASALPDLGCAAFALLALLAFLATWEVPDTATATLLHVAGAASFLVSMLFKEPGAALPGIILLIDLARRPPRHAAGYWGSRYGALAVAAMTYLVLRIHALGGLMPEASHAQSTNVPAAALAGIALWRYIAMLTFPYPLNAFQTFDTAPALPWWSSLIACGVATATAVVRRCVTWTAAAAVTFLTLIPALYAPALLPGLDNPWAERYAYLPSVGLVIAVASGTAWLTRPWRHVAVLTSTIAILIFSSMTVARTTVWHDDLRLWTDTVSKSPGAGAAHAALGHALFSRDDIDGAVKQYRRAIELKPDYADAYLNLGVAYAIQGRHGAALPLYAKTIELQPRNALAHANLAISLSMIGRQRDAHAEAVRSIELRPNLAKGHLALGMALGNSDDISGAAQAFRRATELDPTDELARANLVKAEAILARRPLR